MNRILLYLGTIVPLCLPGMAAYAADPDSGMCTVIEQKLARPSYDIMVFDEHDGALVPLLKRSIQDTQQSYPNELGKAQFNLITVTPDSEVSDYAANENTTVYICANASYDFCNRISATAITLNTEWSEVPSGEEDVRANAAGHIARASVSLIQQFEAGNNAGEPAFLPKTHLLSK